MILPLAARSPTLLLWQQPWLKLRSRAHLQLTHIESADCDETRVEEWEAGEVEGSEKVRERLGCSRGRSGPGGTYRTPAGSPMVCL